MQSCRMLLVKLFYIFEIVLDAVLGLICILVYIGLPSGAYLE